MPEIEDHPAGTAVWFDLMTDDLDAAIAFYSAMFGWEIEVGPDELGRYSMATMRGRPIVGLMPVTQPDQASSWTVFFRTDDVDGSATTITSHGGSLLMEPTDVLDLGRTVAAADPSGATFGLWRPGRHRGTGIVDESGTPCWVELATRDADGASLFYRNVFGWDVSEPDGEHGHYQQFRLDGVDVAGLMPMIGPTWDAIADNWMVYFQVDDADEAVESCAALGGTVAVPPMQVPPGRFAVLADPQGAHLSVLELVPAAVATA